MSTLTKKILLIMLQVLARKVKRVDFDVEQLCSKKAKEGDGVKTLANND